MVTVAQIQANRLNAQKSTGPRTAEGKERASQNAIKHGLLAQEAVIVGENPAEFEMYREGMLPTLAPAGAVEAMLAERVVGLSWRLLRAERLQNIAYAALEEGEPTDVLEERLDEWKQVKGSDWDRSVTGVVDENFELGRLVAEDFAGARVLDRLLMYERRIESSLYRTMAELRKEREARTAANVTEETSRAEGDLAADREPVTPAKLASFGTEPTPEEVSVTTHQASSEGRGWDTAADSGAPCPGGSDKRSLRSLSMASSQGQDHRQTSLPLPPGVEERPLSTSRDRAPMSCETNPMAEEVSSLKCQVSNDRSDFRL